MQTRVQLEFEWQKPHLAIQNNNNSDKTLFYNIVSGHLCQGLKEKIEKLIDNHLDTLFPDFVEFDSVPSGFAFDRIIVLLQMACTKTT